MYAGKVQTGGTRLKRQARWLSVGRGQCYYCPGAVYVCIYDIIFVYYIYMNTAEQNVGNGQRAARAHTCL